MSEEERPSGITLVQDAHAMLLRQVERGSAMMRSLALVTVVVAALLALAYGVQLALSALGMTVVEVNVNDPLLIGVEVLLFVLAIAWLYVGVRNYRFTTILAKQVKAVRAAESDLMRKHGLEG